MTPSTDLEQLIETARELHARGWLLATAGNLSIRTETAPTRYLVSGSGGHKGRLRADDFVELGLGLDQPSSRRKPSAEAVVHDRLYARLGCACILHVHGPAATLVARHWVAAGCVDVSGFEYVKALGFWEPAAAVRIPIVPNHHDLVALADAVADSAGAVPAVLVASHGVYAWGASVPDAQRHIEATEVLCQLVWEELKAGLRAPPA